MLLFLRSGFNEIVSQNLSSRAEAKADFTGVRGGGRFGANVMVNELKPVG